MALSNLLPVLWEDCGNKQAGIVSVVSKEYRKMLG